LKLQSGQADRHLFESEETAAGVAIHATLVMHSDRARSMVCKVSFALQSGTQ